MMQSKCLSRRWCKTKASELASDKPVQEARLEIPARPQQLLALLYRGQEKSKVSQKARRKQNCLFDIFQMYVHTKLWFATSQDARGHGKGNDHAPCFIHSTGATFQISLPLPGVAAQCQGPQLARCKICYSSHLPQLLLVGWCWHSACLLWGVDPLL